MELSLFIVFWYGLLHAFYPDHLMVIADFSINKNKYKTFLITLFFAVGHGASLFIFALLFQYINISESLLSYGDIISAFVIIFMGLYLLFMVFTQRIQLSKHYHNNQEHIHVWFGKSHKHQDNNRDKNISLSLGILMGASGVRGMLITLGVVQNGDIGFSMVFAFTLGVVFVFGFFGLFMFYINKKLLNNISNVKRAFGMLGAMSLVVGTNILMN